jgi:ABC-type dipeptide/oligopeptide/nickel transport system permease component
MLWVFPSVFGVSILAFFVLSLIPAPSSPAGTDAATAERRDRFLDLPLFFNLRAEDVRSRTARALQDIAVAEPGSVAGDAARRELLRLGGAALPVLLPRLDGLSPEARVRVALALAPLAERMGLAHQGEIHDADEVVLFWNRFWEARGIEFREANARTAVARYGRHGTEARAEQLRLLDTYALPYLFELVERPADPSELPQLGRLLEVMSQVTGRDDRLAEATTVEAAAVAVDRWRHWWLVHAADYQSLSGADRVAAVAVQTRYGKWVYEALWLRMGTDDEGRAVQDQLAARAKLTFTILLSALALAYALAVPLGSVAAWRRGSMLDRLVALTVLLAHAASPAALALLAFAFGTPLSAPVAWAVVILTVVLVAEPTCHQRGQLGAVLVEDYVRAAAARGAGPLRIVVVHGLRNAMLPVVTRAALELPLAVTSCFVLEKAFSIPGLGQATLEAVARHDVMWLMVLAVGGAALAVTALVVTDLGYAAVDPRLRTALTAVRRGRA